MGKFIHWINENKKRSVEQKKEFVKSVMNKFGKTMPAIDSERYGPIKGLEGPYRSKRGKILYYDPKEGKYWDRDSDMYVDEGLDENFSQQIAAVKQDRMNLGAKGFTELETIKKALLLIGQYDANKLSTIVQKIAQEVKNVEEDGNTAQELKSGLASLRSGISRIS